jgi:hypothetical protein
MTCRPLLEAEARGARAFACLSAERLQGPIDDPDDERHRQLDRVLVVEVDG